jgi:hypothetical protein
MENGNSYFMEERNEKSGAKMGIKKLTSDPAIGKLVQYSGVGRMVRGHNLV